VKTAVYFRSQPLLGAIELPACITQHNRSALDHACVNWPIARSATLEHLSYKSDLLLLPDIIVPPPIHSIVTKMDIYIIKICLNISICVK
jgi:hypothetical protein